MGYNTRYTIEDARPCGVDAFIDMLTESGDYGREAFVGVEPVKWYEHDKDIARLMLKHEILLVALHGEGEEQGDVWDREFRLCTVQGDGEHVEVSEFRYELRRAEMPSSHGTLR